MEKKLRASAPGLGIDVSPALVTAVGFQSLVGSEFGEARVAAEPVHHAAIADLMQDLPHTHSPELRPRAGPPPTTHPDTRKAHPASP